MKLSVVIPAYNEEKFISRCLSSLAKQTLPKKDFEVIVVVDKATMDKTVQIAKNFGARVFVESRRGITFARQKGVEKAKGEIIVGTDADCLLPVDFLAKIVSKFKDKNISGVCGSMKLENPPAVIAIMSRVFVEFADFHSRMLNESPICWAMNFSFRKKDFEDIGGYPLDFPLLEAGLDAQGSDEYEFLKKFLVNKKQVVFDKHICLTTSARRFKKRLLYWFFIEYILGYMINPQLYKLSGKFIKIPPASEKIIPSRVYAYALQTLFIFLCTSLLYGWNVLLTTPQTPKTLPQKAQTELKKLIALRSSISDFSEGITASKARIEELLEEKGIYLR